MKKLIILLLINFVIDTYCQDKPKLDIKKVESSSSKSNQKSSKPILYYFSGEVDSTTIFKLDTLILTKNKKLPNRLDLQYDSKFCFRFDIKLDTITKLNRETGLMTMTVIPSTDDIKCGQWRYYNDKKNIEFKINDLKINYSIIQKTDSLLYIRQRF